jgi:hypothetical protein
MENRLVEALSHPEWIKAMEEEMEALKKNKTSKLVPLPRGKRPVGCWYTPLSSRQMVERYKARLVAKGFLYLYLFY